MQALFSLPVVRIQEPFFSLVIDLFWLRKQMPACIIHDTFFKESLSLKLALRMISDELKGRHCLIITPSSARPECTAREYKKHHFERASATLLICSKEICQLLGLPKENDHLLIGMN